MRRTTNLLIFTSQINLPSGILVNLNFEIFRSVNGSAPVKAGATYAFGTTAAASESKSFSFQFADKNAVEGIYTYSVQISSNSTISLMPDLTVTNATLTILAIRT
jgi:hypothetical protein